MATREDIVEALQTVEERELGMDIVELGLIYDVEIEGPKVKVIHTRLTSMGCPAGQMIEENIHEATVLGRRASKRSTSSWSGIRRGRRTGCPKTPSSSWASVSRLRR